MSIKKYKAVNTTNTTMKGERKMNSQKLNWANIYDGGDAHKIIKGLYDREDWQELHVALWAWLSFNGEREKPEWFEKFGVPRVSNDCFACEMAEASFDDLPKWDQDCLYVCHCCPLTDSPSIECLNGLYRKWLETFGEEREEVAMEIASLEWQYK